MKSTRKMFKVLLGGGFLFLLFFMLAGYATAQETCVPAPAGLVSWWDADSVSGTTAFDLVGENDGTMVGGVAIVPGMVGNAFSFDGVNDHVKVTGSANLQLTGDFTIDAWVRPNPGYGQQAAGHIDIVGRWGPGGVGKASWLLAVNNQGKVIVFTHNGFTTTLLSSVHTIPVNTFSHIAGVRQGTTFKVFIDGVVDNFSSALVAPQVSNLNVFIGQEDPECAGCNGGNNFNGLIDELEIYNSALSDLQIEAIFSAGGAGKCKVEVAIDIKPGSDPNSINPGSKGNIPVAILTTGAFDATTVDETTVLFGATGTEAAPVHAALEDVDGDLDIDMILHFNTQDTGIVCGDISASLTGKTLGGQTIHGSDSIKTVGCK